MPCPSSRREAHPSGVFGSSVSSVSALGNVLMALGWGMRRCMGSAISARQLCKNAWMFSWDDARYFLEVQRAGSLSAAGRRLRVNQSTVGRRLAALEATLGARLFERTPDGYVLTAAGETFLPRAERM